MKAVIVIDVGDDFDLSQIHANVELYSNDLESTFHKGYLLKQVRPLPSQMEYNDNLWTSKAEEEYYKEGWNRFYETITGETE